MKERNQYTAQQFRKQHCDTVEHTIQKVCVQWFDLQYPGLLIYAIPNGGKRSKAEAGRLKAEGVRAGVPDLYLAVVTLNHPGLYIETKTTTGTPSDEQLIAHAYLRGQGYQVELVRSLEQFQAIVREYLKS